MKIISVFVMLFASAMSHASDIDFINIQGDKAVYVKNKTPIYSATDLEVYLGRKAKVRLVEGILVNGYVITYYKTMPADSSTRCINNYYKIAIYNLETKKFIKNIEMEVGAENSYLIDGGKFYYIADGVVASVDTRVNGVLTEDVYETSYCGNHLYCAAAHFAGDILWYATGSSSEMINQYGSMPISDLRARREWHKDTLLSGSSPAHRP